MDDLRHAATEAGFSVLRMISEPVAATLAYGIGQENSHDHCNVLVYRLGGTGMDVSLVGVNNGMYRILDSIEETCVSGNSFTQGIVEHFVSDYKRSSRHVININERSMCKLQAAAEHCKHVLSTVHTAQSFVESMYEGDDYNCQITRARLEGLCSGLLQKCLAPIGRLLTATDLAVTDVHKVLLCGGGSKMPCLQQSLREYFPQAELLASIAPDEVIAIGAAKQAAILTGSEDEENRAVERHVQLPCLSKAIVVQVNESGQLDLVFPGFTPIPCRRQMQLPVGADGRFHLSIAESSSSSRASLDAPLAKIMLQGLPTDGQVVGVFHFRSDGSLHATCTEKTTNNSQSVTIETS